MNSPTEGTSKYDPRMTIAAILFMAVALAEGVVMLVSYYAHTAQADELKQVREANALIIANFEPKKKLDDVCPAWLFQTNIEQARDRICKGRK